MIAMQELIHHAKKHATYSESELNDALNTVTRDEQTQLTKRFKGKKSGELAHSLVGENCLRGKGN